MLSSNTSRILSALRVVLCVFRGGQIGKPHAEAGFPSHVGTSGGPSRGPPNGIRGRTELKRLWTFGQHATALHAYWVRKSLWDSPKLLQQPQRRRSSVIGSSSARIGATPNANPSTKGTGRHCSGGSRMLAKPMKWPPAP